jgi:hypothetical protein
MSEGLFTDDLDAHGAHACAAQCNPQVHQPQKPVLKSVGSPLDRHLPDPPSKMGAV